MKITTSDNGLLVRHQGETLLIQPWGENAFRVRATRYAEFTGNNYALEEDIPVVKRRADSCINPEGNAAEITNGRLKITVNPSGVLRFFRDGTQFLQDLHETCGQALSAHRGRTL